MTGVPARKPTLAVAHAKLRRLERGRNGSAQRHALIPYATVGEFLVNAAVEGA